MPACSFKPATLKSGASYSESSFQNKNWCPDELHFFHGRCSQRSFYKTMLSYTLKNYNENTLLQRGFFHERLNRLTLWCSVNELDFNPPNFKFLPFGYNTNANFRLNDQPKLCNCIC